jgi:hypothetical protein
VTIGKMSGSGRDKHGEPLASVHRLDPERPRRRGTLPEPPAALKEETPAPDRNAALNMLGTFDLGDVDSRSPDEILATLDPAPTVSGPDDPPKGSTVDGRAVAADTPAVEGGQSDEILRELEEYHQRGPTSARPSAPRGSAELELISRRNAPPLGKQEVRGRASGESKPRGRKRVVLALAAAAVFTATASVVTLSQLGGAPARPPTPIRSTRLAAITSFRLVPTNLFDRVANTIANEERQLIRRVESRVQHPPRGASVRKRSARSYVAAHAAVAAVASTAGASSTPSQSTASQPPAQSASQPLESSGSSATTASRPGVSSEPVGPIGPGYVIGSNCNPKCR